MVMLLLLWLSKNGERGRILVVVAEMTRRVTFLPFLDYHHLPMSIVSWEWEAEEALGIQEGGIGMIWILSIEPSAFLFFLLFLLGKIC